MTEDRRARIEALVAQNRYSNALEVAAAQLTALGVSVGLDDAVSRDAAAAAQDAARMQERFHLVWHRAWGVRLRAEVIETANRLADLLEGERAVLIWGRSPPVGFLIPFRQRFGTYRNT